MKSVIRIYKCFHHVTVTVVKERGGEVRSFDGDRVMGVFLNPTDAVNCGLALNGWYRKLGSELKKKFSGKDVLTVGIGIATGDTAAIKVGPPRSTSQDIAWIGDAANLGAELSDIASKTGRKSMIICAQTYKKMELHPDSMKYITKFDNYYETNAYYELK